MSQKIETEVVLGEEFLVIRQNHLMLLGDQIRLKPLTVKRVIEIFESVPEDQMIEDYEIQEAIDVLIEEIEKSEVFFEETEEVREALWMLNKF